MKKKLLAVTLMGLLNPLIAVSDEYQYEIETIEVKGELLPTTTDTASNAVEILTDDVIEVLGASHLQDVLNQMGNVNFAGGSSRARFFQIRGMGERSQFVDPVNPSVGIAIDGIDYTGMANAATLFDISQIEVFKGPQGTGVGANAMAGFINLYGTEPGSGQETKLRLEAGNYGMQNIAAAHGGDIGDHSEYRVSVNKLDGNGYIDNVHLNRDDTNGFDELSVRLKTNSRINDDWSVSTVIHKFDIDNGYDAFSLDLNRNTLSDEPGFDKQDTTSFAIKAKHTGLDNLQQTFFVSTSNSDLAYGYDEDWSFVGIHEDGYSSTDHYFRDRSATQLDYTLGDKDNNWVVGLYHQDKSTDLDRAYFDFDLWMPAAFDSQYDVASSALYGEKRLKSSSSLTFSAGLRIENYDGDYSDSNAIAVGTSDTMWGGHLSAINKYSDILQVYARLSRGFKAGGVNGEALSQLQDPRLAEFVAALKEQQSFEPEILENIELGIRANSRDLSLIASANLFYSTRDNMQVKQWLTNTEQVQNQGAAPIFVGYISNAPSGTNYGLETNIRYRPNNDVTLSAGLALLESEVEDFDRLEDELVDLSGRAQAHAPEYQYHLSGLWQLTERISTSLSVTGKDGFYYSFSHDAKSSSVELVNASLTYRGDNLDITLWSRNLTDEDYGVRGFRFPNDPRNGYATTTYEQLGEPLVYGVKLDFVF